VLSSILKALLRALLTSRALMSMLDTAQADDALHLRRQVTLLLRPPRTGRSPPARPRPHPPWPRSALRARCNGRLQHGRQTVGSPAPSPAPSPRILASDDHGVAARSRRRGLCGEELGQARKQAGYAMGGARVVGGSGGAATASAAPRYRGGREPCRARGRRQAPGPQRAAQRTRMHTVLSRPAWRRRPGRLAPPAARRAGGAAPGGCGSRPPPRRGAPADCCRRPRPRRRRRRPQSPAVTRAGARERAAPPTRQRPPVIAPVAHTPRAGGRWRLAWGSRAAATGAAPGPHHGSACAAPAPGSGSRR
jgi:hypothetical protein